MPYISEKIKLPEKYDRRIKIKKSDHAVIKQLHKDGEAIRAIARKYKVNKRSIQFILFPERHEKNLINRELRGGWKQYYNTEKNTKAIIETRNYKQSLYLKKLI